MRCGVRSIADVRARADTLPGTATGAATGLTKVGNLESEVVSRDFMKVQDLCITTDSARNLEGPSFWDHFQMSVETYHGTIVRYCACGGATLGTSLCGRLSGDWGRDDLECYEIHIM